MDFVRRFGNRIFYGDASRPEMLRAAGTERAEVFVLAIDDLDASVRTAEFVRQHFPNVKVFARARNRQHAFRLMEPACGTDARDLSLQPGDDARRARGARPFARPGGVDGAAGSASMTNGRSPPNMR